MLYQSCNVACRGDAVAAAAGVQVHPHDPTLRMLIVDGRRSKHCGCCCWLAPHCGLVQHQQRQQQRQQQQLLLLIILSYAAAAA